MDPPATVSSAISATHLTALRALIVVSGALHAAQLAILGAETPFPARELALVGAAATAAVFVLAALALRRLQAADAASSALRSQIEMGERRLHALLRHAADVVLLVDHHGVVGYASHAVLSVFEIPAGSLVGRSLPALFGPGGNVVADLLTQVGARPGLIATGEAAITTNRGGKRIVELRVANLVHDVGVGGYVVHVDDVTEQRRAEQALEFQAGHDALTGLVNRSRLSGVLAGAAAHAEQQRSTYAVVFADLDLFKQVNDQFGHNVGDEVLRTCADRLRTAVRTGDVALRYGGDEFVVVCPGADGAAADAVARRIWDSFHSPMTTSAGPVRIGVSLGIALGPTPSRDPEEPLRQADAAMYRVKHARRN